MTKTTPKPLPSPLAMSVAPKDPAATPLPPQTSPLVPSTAKSSAAEKSRASLQQENPLTQDNDSMLTERYTSRPHPRPAFPSPKLRLECRDLLHPGASLFFQNIDPSTCLSGAVESVLSTLYCPDETNAGIPPTRSVTLILRSMDGVAYTCGIDLDDDHKEIHFSLDYIAGIKSRTPGREAEEIRGVLVHEMVHAWQWNGKGQAPGGLIEGIADFVRLKANLQPPHWKREIADRWDQGYHHTAYFLEWLEETIEIGSVRKINAALKDEAYEEAEFWMKLFGKDVEHLWIEYKAYLEGQHPKSKNPKRTMADVDFWNWVKERKGGEQTMVLKAVWRTRRQVSKGLNQPGDDYGQELESLWSSYLEALHVKGEQSRQSLSRSSSESEDADAVLVAKDDGV